MNGDDILIQSVVFGERWVEITFADPRRGTERVQSVETIAVDPTLVEQELGEVIESLREIVERGQVEQRNPPERLRG